MKTLKRYKNRIALALLAVLVSVLILPEAQVYASSDSLWDDYTMPSTRQKDRLLDNADLLTAEEKAKILQQLDSMSAKHNSNIVILTTDSHSGPIQDFADDYFDYNGFQADYNGSGVLFMLSMEEREWAISTSGTAVQAFTDYGQECMMDEMLPYLSQGNYYEAFSKYIDTSDYYFTQLENGTPFDIRHEEAVPPNPVSVALVCILIGLGVALIPLLFMKKDLTTVHKSLNAEGYQIHSGLHMNLHRDTFLRTSISKVPRPQNDTRSGGGGGSSVHISSSGSSHGGSHGHF